MVTAIDYLYPYGTCDLTRSYFKLGDIVSQYTYIYISCCTRGRGCSQNWDACGDPAETCYQVQDSNHRLIRNATEESSDILWNSDRDSKAHNNYTADGSSKLQTWILDVLVFGFCPTHL